MVRSRRLAGGLVLVAVSIGATPIAYADPPTAAEVAEAKHIFEVGLKLYKEGSFPEALASFQRANQLAPRASILRNIAQCRRDMKDFAGAYDAYRELLAKYRSTLRQADADAVRRAVDELTLVTGMVKIRISEPGAVVKVDDKEVGPTPLDTDVRANLGLHHVSAQGADVEPFTKDVTLAGNDEATVSGPLEKRVLTGHLSIVTTGDPAGSVHVFIDRVDAGPPPLEVEVAAGTHDVEARGQGAAAPPRPIVVARRGRSEVTLALESATGKIQIDPHAALAEIAVDGRLLARGVWEGRLPPGRHELSITLPGFETDQRAFIVHAGETVVEDVHLRPLGGGPATYQGVYADLDVFGLASPGGATNTFTQSCPSAPCSTDTPLGGGLGIRVGYSFGLLALEGMFFGMYDTSSASLSYPMDSATTGLARSESYRFHTYGGVGAIGGRITSKHPHVRVTFGAGVGVEVKGNLYTRSAVGLAADASGKPPTSSMTSSNVTYVAPALIFDTGVLVGPQGGPKFFIGVMALVEAVGAGVLTQSESNQVLGSGPLATPGLQVAGGAQFFIGPLIGLRFGQ